MRETVFYMRGRFPFGVEPSIGPGVVRDASILLQLSPEQLQAVRRDLEGFQGFLDRETMEKLLEASVEDDQQRKGLARFVATFVERLLLTKQSPEALATQLEEWLSEDENREQQLLDESRLPELRERLNLLLSPIPGVARQVKAERLTDVTGQSLESLDIICDIRPVFDGDREDIEGMIPYTLLRVVCKGADGLPIAMEAVLSEQDVHELAEAAEKAKKKLVKIRKLMHDNEIKVPTTNLTKRGQTDVN